MQHYLSLRFIGHGGEPVWPRFISPSSKSRGETLYLGVASPLGGSCDGHEAFLLYLRVETFTPALRRVLPSHAALGSVKHETRTNLQLTCFLLGKTPVY